MKKVISLQQVLKLLGWGDLFSGHTKRKDASSREEFFVILCLVVVFWWFLNIKFRFHIICNTYTHIFFFLGLYSPFRARAYQPTTGLTFTCQQQRWKIIQPLYVWHVASRSSPQPLFSTPELLQKSVVAEIPYGAGLTTMCPAAGDQARDRCLRGSDSASAPKRLVVF